MILESVFKIKLCNPKMFCNIIKQQQKMERLCQIIIQFWMLLEYAPHSYTALDCVVNTNSRYYVLTPSALTLIRYIICKLWKNLTKSVFLSIKKPFKCQITKLESLSHWKLCLNHRPHRSMSRVTFFISPPNFLPFFYLGLKKKAD